MTEEKNIINISEGPDKPKDSLDLEVAYARLKKIGKDKFLIDYNAKGNIIDKVKNSSQYFNIGLPPEFSEYFISIEDSPLFWIMDSPIITFVEENNKLGDKDGIKTEAEPSKLVKDYYLKWVTTPRKSEKKYFAHSLAKSIVKERKNLTSSIYGGMLFSNDETLKNSDTAQEYFEHAELLTKEIEGDENLKNELLYLLKIFSGFEYYLSMKIFESNQKFKQAALLKSEGITVKFYLGLTEIMLGNINAGNDLVTDVYEYDFKRLHYAITNNNFNLFQYFLKNPVSEHIFHYYEFGKICSFLEDYLQVKELDSSEMLTKLRQKFEVFRELHLNEYQDQNVLNSFNFIEKVLKNLFNSPLHLFTASAPLLWERFNETLQLVLSTIRQRFLTEIQAQLKMYDQNIFELNGLINHIVKEIEEFKRKYKEKAKNAILLYEAHFKSQMAFLEKKLAGTSENQHNNPANTFKSSITYTLVLSCLVLLVAGFAGYSTNYSEDLTGFSQIVKAIFVTGGKWGILTFILGLVVSAISAVYAAYERSAEKQQIIKEISQLKYAKEKNVEQIKADTEKSEKITIHNLNKRIEQHKKRITEITAEKERREADLNKQIEVKIAEEAKKLIELMERA